MTSHDGLQVLPSSSDLADRTNDAVARVYELGYWPTDLPIPSIVRDKHLIVILGISSSWFYRRKALGHFRMFEVTPQFPGSDTLYSGSLIEKWRAGDLRVRKSGAVQAVAR